MLGKSLPLVNFSNSNARGLGLPPDRHRAYARGNSLLLIVSSHEELSHTMGSNSNNYRRGHSAKIAGGLFF